MITMTMALQLLHPWPRCVHAVAVAVGYSVCSQHARTRSPKLLHEGAPSILSFHGARR